MKKSKTSLPSPLSFQGRITPIAVSSLLAFGGGGASVYLFLEDSYPPFIQSEKNITFQTCFPPRNQCQPLLISAIDKAAYSIYMQNYSFTAAPLAEALVRAYQRGVEVRLISDKGQVRPKSVVAALARQGIPVYIDQSVALAHNKILIIDEKTVITGSYNFSSVAENRNAENLLMIGSTDLAKQYLENWRERQKESMRFMPSFPQIKKKS